ncbi:DNA-protecting protein DprA [bacterium]|nr:DNA-protecting protein DprA [bacterium]
MSPVNTSELNPAEIDWPVPEDTVAREEEVAAVLDLLRSEKIGARTVWRLIRVFESARMTMAADDHTLERVGGLTPDSIRELREAHGNGFGAAQLERSERLGTRILLPGMNEYPPLLRRIHSPPAALFVSGKPLPTHERCVAMVGSRAASEAGLELAHQIGAGLAKADVAVISGMALGIDGASHRGCLQEGGPTVAVLGCGVDVLYPKKHRKLRDEIARHGSIVSELTMGAGPEAKHFPMRNRIIAGMSVGSVIVEAGVKSGSLITANYALQENREIFTCPGHPLSRSHEGSNWLLRQGAIPVRHAGDILEDLAARFGMEFKGRQRELPLDAVPDDLDEDETRLFHLLEAVLTMHADTVATRLAMDASRTGALLLGMELKGYIQRVPGDRYRKVSPGSWGDA